MLPSHFSVHFQTTSLPRFVDDGEDLSSTVLRHGFCLQVSPLQLWPSGGPKWHE